jgi:Putative lactococcus lactis phage r1t holin
MSDPPIVTKDFWAATALRALRTFAQSLLTLGGADLVGLIEGDWWSVLLTSAGMAAASVLTSIVAGIPEAPRPPPDGRAEYL